MNNALILLPFLVLIWIGVRRIRDDQHLLRLGIALLSEANDVRVDYPEEYPAYRSEAVHELTRLKMGHLVPYLPT